MNSRTNIQSLYNNAWYNPQYWLPLLFIGLGIISSVVWMQLYRNFSDASDNQAYQVLSLPEPMINQNTEITRTFIQKHWQTIKVRPGDNLAKIFSALGIRKEELANLFHLSPVRQMMVSLRPKQELKVLVGTGQELEQLIYPLSLTRSLAISRHGEQFVSKIIEQPLETRVSYVTGSIHDSLFSDAGKAGLRQATIMELVNIFAWEIDFARDLRPGDRFSVIYEDQYRNGEKVGTGHIIAAEFINQDQPYRAIRYTSPSGELQYYTPEGNGLKKAFLRTPVKFTAITSLFSMGRYHPILHRLRAHKGVDYAAPTGTPVKATADGKVSFRGQQGGYGNVVILQHAGHYSTLYGHLSRFARISNGSHVHQGDIIGYVGMTGLATGPHLHYEFRVNGQHRNPLAVKLPYSEPVPRKYLADFKVRARNLMNKLMSLRSSGVAVAKSNTLAE